MTAKDVALSLAIRSAIKFECCNFNLLESDL